MALPPFLAASSAAAPLLPADLVPSPAPQQLRRGGPRSLANAPSPPAVSVTVRSCAALRGNESQKLLNESALVQRFRLMAPPQGKRADLIFLPQPCGWNATHPGELTPTLGYFALWGHVWAAFAAAKVGRNENYAAKHEDLQNMAERMRSLIAGDWPTNFVVASPEAPSYAPSWNGVAGDVSLGRAMQWGWEHRHAWALMVPYNNSGHWNGTHLKPWTLLSRERHTRVAMAANVLGVQRKLSARKREEGENMEDICTKDRSPVVQKLCLGRSPLRQRLVDECRHAPNSECTLEEDIGML